MPLLIVRAEFFLGVYDHLGPRRGISSPNIDHEITPEGGSDENLGALDLQGPPLVRRSVGRISNDRRTSPPATRHVHSHAVQLGVDGILAVSDAHEVPQLVVRASDVLLRVRYDGCSGIVDAALDIQNQSVQLALNKVVLDGFDRGSRLSSHGR